MALKIVHDTVDEIPEQYRDLYTEKDGKFHLTGIAGVKSDKDVATLQEALRKERNDHKTTKDKLAKWGELDPEEVQTQLDSIPTLQEAAKGKLNDQQIDELVEKRIGAKLKPIERERDTFKGQVESLTKENTEFKAQATRRSIHDAVRAEAVKLKVLEPAMEDVLMHAERLFEVSEDGKVVARDQVGITPGITPDIWLGEQQERKSHWWPPSHGGGAGGGNDRGGAGGLKNPWKAENWNISDQAAFIRQHGMDKADNYAKQAGLERAVGNTRPVVKK